MTARNTINNKITDHIIHENTKHANKRIQLQQKKKILFLNKQLENL